MVMLIFMSYLQGLFIDLIGVVSCMENLHEFTRHTAHMVNYDLQANVNSAGKRQRVHDIKLDIELIACAN